MAVVAGPYMFPQPTSFPSPAAATSVTPSAAMEVTPPVLVAQKRGSDRTIGAMQKARVVDSPPKTDPGVSSLSGGGRTAAARGAALQVSKGGRSVADLTGVVPVRVPPGYDSGGRMAAVSSGTHTPTGDGGRGIGGRTAADYPPGGGHEIVALKPRPPVLRNVQPAGRELANDASTPQSQEDILSIRAAEVRVRGKILFEV